MPRLVRWMLCIGPATAAVGLGAILLSALIQSNLLLQVGGGFVVVAIFMLVGGFLGYVLNGRAGPAQEE